eukprot:6888012-Pyramimonas_sp.AAC.1
MCDGRPLQPQGAVPCLGLQISATEREANVARAHHAPKVFREGFIPLQLRVRLWLLLARAIALCGLEACILSDGALAHLERWQATKLRSASRLPAHMTATTNEEVPDGS